MSVLRDMSTSLEKILDKQKPATDSYLGGLPQVSDPEKTYADVNKSQYYNYIRDFRDFEEQQIQDAQTDTSLIEGAREDAAIQSRVAQGIQQRNLERYGSELTPAERAEMARSNQRGSALTLSNAVNNAQIQQEEANTRKLADLINIGQGVNRSSLGQMQSAAQDANARKQAYKSAKAQTKAQNASMAGSLASAAILAFAI